MSYLFRIARKSAGILIAAMLVSLFSGLMVIKYPLFPWMDYSLIRNIHIFFVLIVLIPVFYLHSVGGIVSFLNGKGLAKSRTQKGLVMAGWAAIFLVFALVYSIPTPVISGSGPAFAMTGPVSLNSTSVTLTSAEIATHGSAGSCWVIIGGKVYDLTSFLTIHPGGTGAILPYCGKDGSTGFATKDIGVLHSPYADTLLSAFYIGDLGAEVTGTPSRPPATPTVPSVSPPPTPSVAAGSPVTLTPAEIATHSSAGSCWMIIGGKVYDLTSFLTIHPGGTGAILPYCGKDGSAAFATKNSGSPHSSYADSLLSSYFIGNPGTTVNVTPPPGAVNPPTVRRHEEREDD